MEQLDLEIDNYNLEDILRLFKLDYEFGEQDMKRAKQVVLKTHPDKSKLDPKFFLFYSKAYKVLYQMHEFKNKQAKSIENSNTDYQSIVFGHGPSKGGNGSQYEEQDDYSKKKALQKFLDKNSKLKEVKHFNQWFNEEFEKNKIQNDEERNGYGDWFRSSDENEIFENNKNQKQMSMATMQEEFMKKKQEIRSRAMVVHQEVNETYYNESINTCNIMGDAPEEYSSGLFSQLPYQDLRKAHVESVIPITEEDYHSIPKFKNENEYRIHRSSQEQNAKPLSEIQAQEYLSRREKESERMAAKRAYELAKQAEIVKENNKQFWRNILTLQ